MNNMKCSPWKGLSTIPLEDGHVPENLVDQEVDFSTTRLVTYPLHCRHTTTTTTDTSTRNDMKRENESNNEVYIYQHAFPEDIVDDAYRKTMEEDYPAWGDYVTVQDVERYWQSHSSSSETRTVMQNSTSSKIDNTNPSSATAPSLALQLAAHYLRLSWGETSQATTVSRRIRTLSQSQISNDESVNSTSSNNTEKKLYPLWTKESCRKEAHGIAVWALRAGEGSQVPYHFDYAEQIRYESNVIVPPLIAGTLQCTRNKLKGGDFLISLEGIPHYARHGYKGKLVPLPSHDYHEETTSIEERKNSMRRIPYHYNQLTCHLGTLPHASSKIEAILDDKSGKSPSLTSLPPQRVIVGFNVFCHAAGPIVQRAPEHSAAFRRKVQIQRLALKSHIGNMPKQHKKHQTLLTLENLKQNKTLSKLLVLAKREKVKHQLVEAQEHFFENVLPKYLPCLVKEVMDICRIDYVKNNGQQHLDQTVWPKSPEDIQVYLHRKVQDGSLIIVSDKSPDIAQDSIEHRRNQPIQLLSPHVCISF